MNSVVLKYMGFSKPEDVCFDENMDDLEEMDHVKRDLLNGYLLKLVTSVEQRGESLQSLTALASHLQSKRILPKWVQWTLTQKPSVFNQAFSKVFLEVGLSGCIFCFFAPVSYK